jgi:hypothetical protein
MPPESNRTGRPHRGAEVECLEQFVIAAPWVTANRENEPDHVIGAQVLRELRRLGHVTDARPITGVAVDGHAIEEQLTRVGPDESEDAFVEGRLARAVRPDDRRDLPPRNDQVDSVQHPKVAEAFRKPSRFNHCRDS